MVQKRGSPDTCDSPLDLPLHSVINTPQVTISDGCVVIHGVVVIVPSMLLC